LRGLRPLRGLRLSAFRRLGREWEIGSSRELRATTSVVPADWSLVYMFVVVIIIVIIIIIVPASHVAKSRAMCMNFV